MPPAGSARRRRSPTLGPDAALITSLANVRYLTGLVSSNAALLLPAAGPGVLATDSRYEEAARRDCPDLELVIERFIEPALARLAAARGLATVAFEAQEMTVERHAELAALDDGPALVPLGADGRGAADGQGRGRDRAARPGVRDHRRGVRRRAAATSCPAGPSGSSRSCWSGR